MIKVGIIGATGYTGEELLRMLYHHPKVAIKFITSREKDVSIIDYYPNLIGFYDLPLVPYEKSLLQDVDLIFIALPHGYAEEMVKDALEANIKIIDLGADFRFEDPKTYEQWYKIDAPSMESLCHSIYGLPELHREKIKNAQLIGNPGCYVTSSILTLAPAIHHHLIDFKNIIVDAKSGVSGAGRTLNSKIHFLECNENINPYNICSHRHTPEIEKELSKIGKEEVMISFVPHLVPMNRGILTTCYGNLTQNISSEEIKQIYKDFYKDERFIHILDAPPHTKFVKGSNFCHIYPTIDSRTNRLVSVGAIDNLIKGASGQAIQNLNLLFDLPENTGLETISLF